jgi:hypothetical protein
MSMSASMSKKFLIVGAILVCVLIVACAGMGKKAIISEGAKWEEISSAGRVFAEGVVAAKDGKLYMTDITPTAAIKENNPGGTVYRYDPATGKILAMVNEPSFDPNFPGRYSLEQRQNAWRKNVKLPSECSPVFGATHSADRLAGSRPCRTLRSLHRCHASTCGRSRHHDCPDPSTSDRKRHTH